MDWFRGRRAWYVEAALLVAGYLLFGAARAGVDRGDPTATDNALLVERVERTVHIAVEYPLNQAMLGNPGLIYVTGYYYRLCLLAVPAILIWVYLRRPARYRYLRTVLVITTLLDLPLVFLFPESPPRFALAGVVDYMASYDILSGAGSRVARSGVNLLAAMPSMHIAWTTWCAYAVWSVSAATATRRRLAGVVFPGPHRLCRHRHRPPLRPRRRSRGGTGGRCHPNSAMDHRDCSAGSLEA